MKPFLAYFLVVSALLVLGAGRPARAQRALVQEFAGSTVLLTSGDTLRGPLTLYADRDVLVIRQPDQTLRTVPALSVRAFAVRGERGLAGDYFEQDRDFVELRRGFVYGQPAWATGPAEPPRATPDTARLRVFHALRWNHGDEYANYCRPAFFEQLSRGPVVLLRRQTLLERPAATLDPVLQAYGGTAAAASRGTAGYYVSVRSQFFLATPSGQIVPLRSPRRHLLAYFQAEAAELEQYVRDNRLDFNDSRELASIVNYANALRAARPPQQAVAGSRP